MYSLICVDTKASNVSCNPGPISLSIMAATAVDGADEASGQDGAGAGSPSTPEAVALKVDGDVMTFSDEEEESPARKKRKMDETPPPCGYKKDKDTPEGKPVKPKVIPGVDG